MRPWLLIPALAAVALAVWALTTGADARLAEWAAAWQRDFQNALAGALRALRAGDPGAVTAMLTLCFGYGFVHAVGPGHGKVVIGGYGLGARVAALRLSAIAVASSLMQAVSAIALVALGFALFGWTRQRMTGLADDTFADISAAAIGLVGLWLLVRGLRHAIGARTRAHGHDPHDDHDHHGPDCGHRHGPTADEAARVTGWRDAALLIASIGIRPCTGALFLLIITWHMGLVWAGIAGTFAMAAGTASVTFGVALASVTARESLLRAMNGGRRLALALPALEIAAGGFVCLVAWRMLLG